MNKVIMIAAVIAAIFAGEAARAAASQGSLAGGVKVGTLSGFTGKYWISDSSAVDFTVGSLGFGDVTLDATFLFNQFGLFSSERDDLNKKVSLYYGLGGLAYFPTVSGPSSYGGIKGTVGLVYLFPEPFEIYGEVSPAIMMSTPSTFGFLGAIGARYYFGTEKKASKTAE